MVDIEYLRLVPFQIQELCIAGCKQYDALVAHDLKSLQIFDELRAGIKSFVLFLLPTSMYKGEVTYERNQAGKTLRHLDESVVHHVVVRPQMQTRRGNPARVHCQSIVPKKNGKLSSISFIVMIREKASNLKLQQAATECKKLLSKYPTTCKGVLPDKFSKLLG
jgi:hypothetical protein